MQKKDAEAMVEDYIQSLHNSDLKLGKITEKDGSFEAEILGKNKVVVDTIIVDKNTGWMQSATERTGQGSGSWLAVTAGSRHDGPGYYGMGPGMMGPGYQGVWTSIWFSPGPQYQQQGKPLTEKDVRAMWRTTYNPRATPTSRWGRSRQKTAIFEAEIVTKKNDALVDTILVDKNTGWMRSIY